jgi:tRNA(Ile)-lysidine synthase
MSQSSHPPSLLTLVSKTLVQQCELPLGAAIALGVSGGPDSMALLHTLTLCRQKLGLKLLAISVDHGLRPEAREELTLVSDFCRQHQVDFVGAELGLAAGANLHARARAARYECLWSEAKQHLGEACFLATAHHKNDRAETVLLRILRGSSLAGLSVLKARNEQLLRPMILAGRADVELHLKRHGIPFVTDPSNVNPRFLRTRIRTEVLPVLEALAPGVIEHLVALAEEASELPEPLGLSREHRAQLRKAAFNPYLAIDLRLPSGLRLYRAPRGE